MKRSVVVTGVAAIVVAGFAVWLLRSGGEHTALDLIEQFPTAAIKRPRPEVFTVEDVSIAGVSHKAIAPSDPARVGWHLMVPDNAWLKVSLGMKEQSWTMQGNGVIMQILVNNGKTSEELVRLHVNPFTEPGDRQWKDLTLDLSPYAGQAVDLIFNNLSGPDPPRGQPFVDDRNGDLPLWGAPRVVIK
jgi:hypothetical protein